MNYNAVPFQHPPKSSTAKAFEPLKAARLIIERRFTTGEQITIRYYRDSFYRWVDGRWQNSEDGEIRAIVYAVLEETRTDKGRATMRVGIVTPARVSDTIDALRATVRLSSAMEIPTWLGVDVDRPPAREFVAVGNGLLHLPAGELWPATPNYFGLGGVDVTFAEHGPAPKAWLNFLAGLWGDDKGSIGTLQEFAGYVLSADTRQQKALLLIGPRRSGKGTIAKILRALAGRAASVGPTLTSLSRPFGLQCLVGKRLAVIPDARIDRHADRAELVERLLSLIGGDEIEIERKNLGNLSMREAPRFVMLTNELPRLPDASQALAGRFIPLVLRRSFYGVENIDLADELLVELPAILCWALEGLHRLWARGFFIVPQASLDVIGQLHDLSSPVQRFIDDECVTEPASVSIECGLLYQAWTRWCEENGRKPGTAQNFARDLRAALPALHVQRPRNAHGAEDSTRPRRYVGVTLRPTDKSSPM